MIGGALRLVFALGAVGAPVDPPAPAIPAELLAAPQDLAVTLWARSPLLRNPTNIDVDAKGRVWVAEGVNYRYHAGRVPDGDRIVVLEDTDGDGRADRSTTFVQEPGLISPLGIAVIDRQVVVSNAPDLIVYTDVDGDGRFDARVDRREILLSGFQGRNHDHGLHSVTFGPDGRWYFNQGNTGAVFTDRSGRTFRAGSTYAGRGPAAVKVYNWEAADIAGAPSDDGRVYAGGFAVRMNPDGTNAEIVGFNFRNSYEQTVTSFGDIFQSDNDDPPACRTSFLLEYGNAGYLSRDGRRTWQADRRPGQSVAVAEWRQDDPGVMPAGDVYGEGAPAGIVQYEGDELGEKWRGLLLSCEAGRNTVFGYFPQPDGAGFRLKRFVFLTSNPAQRFSGLDSQRGRVSPELASWFRPSDVAVGPDGAIYVADWFDPRVGGGRDLDRSTGGAIYRIAPKSRKLATPRIDLGTIDGQIAALRSPAVNVRASGFLRLRARGDAAFGPVAGLLDDANPYVRARAIWLLAQLGDRGIAAAEGQLRSPDPRYRIAAFRALKCVHHRVIEEARALAADPSPAVRREVALALRDQLFDRARDILLTLAGGYDGVDRTYLEAWGTGCSGKEAAVYAELARRAPDADASRWPARYANLIWRLTPAGAEHAFGVRAAASGLAEADRLAAVTALGFIPTRDAMIELLGLAQGSPGPVRNHALWWLVNYGAIRWERFGVAAALKERGLFDPDKMAILASPVPEAPPTRLPPVAKIAALKGDPRRGAASAQACLMCHRIGDRGVDYGPGLTGFARNQTPETVINAIVNPSADIAYGYEGTEFILRDGTVVDGLLLGVGDPSIVESMGGVTQTIPAARIRSRRPLARSLMLGAEQLGLSAQDVADIAAYLRSGP